MRLSTGPILSVIVPMTIRRSDCRGENRTTSAPNLATSYCAETTDMYSMAQQAVPKGSGQSEFLRAQLAISLTVVVKKLSPTADSIAISTLFPVLRLSKDGLPWRRSSWFLLARETQHRKESR